MKKYWIITAILVVLCAAVPVVAQEVLPTLEEQVQDILVRLEKVEAQEKRDRDAGTPGRSTARDVRRAAGDPGRRRYRNDHSSI